MSTAKSPVEWVACPDCGQAIGYRAQYRGRRGHCQACGHEFRLPGQGAPEYVGFACTLCATRLTARNCDVGKQMKCPDCGTRTRVPPPELPPPPSIPHAMQGEQYELWGVDEAPLPEELIRRQKPHHRFECGKCRTPMYATTEQLGKRFICPDCGTRTRAEQAEDPDGRGVTPPPYDDGDLELDEASAPTPRPVPTPIAVLEAQKHEAARANRDERRQRKRRRETRTSQPRCPLLQRVFAMLATSEVVARWLALSVGLLAVGTFAAPVFAGDASAGGGFGAIAAICFLAVACILGCLWLGAAAAVWLALVTESADGHDRLHDPPSVVFLDWMGEAPYVVVAASASLAAGWATTSLLSPLEVSAAPFSYVGAAFVVFPFALLSALEEGSPLGVFSAGLAATLWRRPHMWLLFYFETLVLAAGVGWAVMAMVGRGQLAILAAVPLALAGTFLYFRLLGRLGWWLATRHTEPT